MDCLAGPERPWNPNAKNRNFNERYQINSSTWYDSGTILDYATNNNDLVANTSVAVAELYKKQIQAAISNFGEGNALYGKDVLIAPRQ